MLVMVYAPELSVVAVRERPLTALESVTVALAMTAPVGSVTVPETVPAFPADWARAGAGAGRRCEETCAWTRGAATESDVARMTNAAGDGASYGRVHEVPPVFGLPDALLTRSYARTMSATGGGGRVKRAKIERVRGRTVGGSASSVTTTEVASAGDGAWTG